MLIKLLALLAVMSANVGLQVLVYMKGWGMQPQSWWWIIGIGIFANAVMAKLTVKVVEECAK